VGIKADGKAVRTAQWRRKIGVTPRKGLSHHPVVQEGGNHEIVAIALKTMGGTFKRRQDRKSARKGGGKEKGPS